MLGATFYVLAGIFALFLGLVVGFLQVFGSSLKNYRSSEDLIHNPDAAKLEQ